MTKLELAIAELKKLPPEMQEDWAAMILDQLEQQEHYTLTDEQIEEVKRRLAEKNPEVMTLEEFEDFVVRLTARSSSSARRPLRIFGGFSNISLWIARKMPAAWSNGFAM